MPFCHRCCQNNGKPCRCEKVESCHTGLAHRCLRSKGCAGTHKRSAVFCSHVTHEDHKAMALDIALETRGEKTRDAKMRSHGLCLYRVDWFTRKCLRTLSSKMHWNWDDPLSRKERPLQQRSHYVAVHSGLCACLCFEMTRYHRELRLRMPAAMHCRSDETFQCALHTVWYEDCVPLALFISFSECF